MSDTINLTPHAIRVVDADNQLVREYQPSGAVARVATSTQDSGQIDGVHYEECPRCRTACIAKGCLELIHKEK